MRARRSPDEAIYRAVSGHWPNEWHLSMMTELAKPGPANLTAGRRSGKSTTVWASVLKRAITGQEIGFTAQSQLGARRQLMGVHDALSRSGLTGWEVRLGMGSEELRIPGAGRVEILAPLGDSFRGRAYDCVVVDEAQSHSSARGDDLIQGYMPTQDTRPGAASLTAGTAQPAARGRSMLRDSAVRDRMLWPSPPDGLDVTAPEVWRQWHPGLRYGLTTEQVLADNLRRMGEEAFAAEYLSIWGDLDLQDEDAWLALGAADGHPDVSTIKSFGVDASSGVYAVAAAAGTRREPVVWLLAARTPTPGPLIAEATLKHRRAPLGREAGGWGVATLFAEIDNWRPARRVARLSGEQWVAATQDVQRGIDAGTLTHYGQDDLTQAVLAAEKKQLGQGAWVWRRTPDTIPLLAVVAAVGALPEERTRT